MSTESAGCATNVDAKLQDLPGKCMGKTKDGPGDFDDPVCCKFPIKHVCNRHRTSFSTGHAFCTV